MNRFQYLFIISAWLLALFGLVEGPAAAQEFQVMLVAPGDTWEALAYRFGTEVGDLQQLNPHPNRRRQPVIGRQITVPLVERERSGRSIRPLEGGLLTLALEAGVSPWLLAAHNGFDHPQQPVLGRLIWLPGDAVPRELPPGFYDLELSHIPGRAGEAMGLRAAIDSPEREVGLRLGDIRGFFQINPNSGRGVGLLATGAFFEPGTPELAITVDHRYLWTQPWGFEEKEWTFNQITLTGEAAQISQEDIQAERERLFEIWDDISPAPQWSAPFTEPVQSYLEYSSLYGARRSYNGGPYRTYHEGLDFAAFGGTPVVTPAGGTVVLAEQLSVRGGAVIIDHGLGIFSGYYHMASVLVEPGQRVAAGDQIGEVGSTGLSTGNHLHWDLLVNGIWIDPQAWREQGLECWILTGWGETCQKNLTE